MFFEFEHFAPLLPFFSKSWLYPHISSINKWMVNSRVFMCDNIEPTFVPFNIVYIYNYIYININIYIYTYIYIYIDELYHRHYHKHLWAVDDFKPVRPSVSTPSWRRQTPWRPAAGNRRFLLTRWAVVPPGPWAMNVAWLGIPSGND